MATSTYGPDLAQLQTLSDRVTDLVRRVPGFVDVRATVGHGLTYLPTAMVAALGFVPIALSTSPGSEVQRPILFPAVCSLAPLRRATRPAALHGP